MNNAVCCPDCENQVEAEDNFCGKCGKMLRDVKVNEGRCPQCQRDVVSIVTVETGEEQMPVCGYCGHRHEGQLLEAV
jgi:predicted amidophosphoribosyltransferase